ncbi:C1 family peptidase [Xenophilus arseniciresistens]|uniref:C1 family peptidase n=1 Tax=Xenophilus arseniciresistens TaxID=1283306 RepID=A0AAE3SZC3_9BURK|nr:C1 family peptidase [Xenophilus arseniciresistens]MDA7416944.1 C1 family peptidase [Xenophilus arseniciresistens]
MKADPIDFRDRAYAPPVRTRPGGQLLPQRALPVLQQGNSSACTGFALATVVHWLLGAEGGTAEPVSPFMIYSMARRYDEFPGATQDTGSSLRGALKGWHKHGVCRRALWPREPMPKEVPEDPRDDWWPDAMRRPLGAYYRIDPRALADMHVALADVGVLYASAMCHGGWSEGFGLQPAAGGAGTRTLWAIPQRELAPGDGGHAFVILGYTHEGFIIQNSWGREWGSEGRALLRYEDWGANAMDCWVVQMGVATSQHLKVAESASLRMPRAGKVELATEERLRNHELAPYIVNMENNGRLSDSGDFRTSEGDVQALVGIYLARAREQWKLAPDAPVDIAIYAHGGLTSEADAARTAARWIPALYERHIFPIFFMWETGLLATLGNIVKDLFDGEDTRTRGGLQNWWNTRLERTLARPGTAIWGEMKENGRLISGARNGGGRVLYDSAMKSEAFKPGRDRIHLIGHSAGGIVHCHLVDLLAGLKWKFHSVNLMAPAATVELFEQKLLPHIQSGAVRQYNQWHLSDPLESADSTCRPILGYGRSLLYLVSESFEGGQRTPILGMQKYLPPGLAERANVALHAAQSRDTQSATHGGFDDDEATQASVIRRILAAGAA